MQRLEAAEGGHDGQARLASGRVAGPNVCAHRGIHVVNVHETAAPMTRQEKTCGVRPPGKRYHTHLRAPFAAEKQARIPWFPDRRFM